MVIIYGCGQHVNMIMEEYYIPVNDIEAIIDNRLSKKIDSIGTIKVVSFEQYLNEKINYKADKFVIGAKAHYPEIKSQLMVQAGIPEKNIIYIDEWVKTCKSVEKTSNYLNNAYRSTETNYIKQLIYEIGELSDKSLKDCKVLSNREMACKFIPKNSIIAEIGVAFGDFSTVILNNCSPYKFYAIDMFSDKTKGFWGQNIFESENITHAEWYTKKFKNYIDKNILEIRKGISWECLDTFPNNYFDYVYVDAAHDYESVKKDIQVLKRVVKNKGIIQFNDYIHIDWSGVIPAVHELVKDTDSKVLYYCLSRDGADDIVIQLEK